MIDKHTNSKSHTSAPATPSSIVYVVDDDPDVRDGLTALFESVGIESRTFSSTAKFVAQRVNTVSCLVLDIRLSGTSGLDFQKRLTRAGIDIPVIFITGHGDVQMAVQAMKAGALQFLTKPLRVQDVLDAVYEGLAQDRERRNQADAVAALKERYESLSAREREVLPLVTAGLLNKQIAHEMKIAEVTVKVHRGSMMKKLRIRRVPELVTLAGALGIG